MTAKLRDYAAMGRVGGLKRTEMLSAERRKEISRSGGIARRDDGADFSAMGQKGGKMRTGPRGKYKPRG